MEFFKSRTETKELRRLRYLHPRMVFSEKESNYYWNLEKGFLGEKKFDEWLTTLPDNCLVLNDLLLEVNNSYFQIDSTLIFNSSTHLLDVKNFEGSCFVDGDRWYTVGTKKELKNPLQQLKRSEMLFRMLQKELKYHSTIDNNLVFVNPEFYLYQAPLDPTFIFPTQINRFIDTTSRKPSRISDSQIKFAKKLQSLHIEDNPFARIPTYNYEKLDKGIACAKCYSLNTELKTPKLVCQNCDHEEILQTAILRSAEELFLLFPDKKLTVDLLHDWCKIVESKKTIRTILKRNFTLLGRTKSRHYVHA